MRPADFHEIQASRMLLDPTGTNGCQVQSTMKSLRSASYARSLCRPYGTWYEYLVDPTSNNHQVQSRTYSYMVGPTSTTSRIMKIAW